MGINESMRKRWKRSSRRRKEGQGGGVRFPCISGETETQQTFMAVTGGKRIVCACARETENYCLSVHASHARAHLYFASKVT